MERRGVLSHTIKMVGEEFEEEALPSSPASSFSEGGIKAKGECLACGNAGVPGTGCLGCGGPIEPKDDSFHYQFGWHDGPRSLCLVEGCVL